MQRHPAGSFRAARVLKLILLLAVAALPLLAAGTPAQARRVKDTTPPSAPGNVVAKAGDQKVDLAWTASTDNVSVKGYRIYRNGGQVASVAGATLSYTDAPLANGMPDTYTVRAYDQSGNLSLNSNQVSATPTASSGSTSPSSPPIAGNWTLRVNDEFTSIDTSRWDFKFWWNGDSFWPSQELQLYRQANCTSDGTEAVMTARKESTTMTNFAGSTTNSVGEPWQYTSCLLDSGGIKNGQVAGLAFTYGYVEARIWVPGGRGIWPGFWMTDANYSDSTELDIMEVIGSEPNTLQMHFHGPQGVYGASYTNPTPLSAGWHTYGLDWEPGKLTWYLDGVARASVSRSDVPSNAHYVLFNLAVGGKSSWPGAPDSTTPFPSLMRVDWMRVWQ